MIPLTPKIQPALQINILAKRWPYILALMLSALLLLIARSITLAYGASAPSIGYLLDTPTLTPTTIIMAVSTRASTAAGLSAPASTITTTVKVSGDSVNLRAGPGTIFSKIRVLEYGDWLTLLGRLSDDSWLYVKTSDGQEGWIKTTSVDVARVNLDNYPIRTPSPSETTVKVNGGSVNLRTGPNTDFSIIRRLDFGELLMLVGRLSDDTWIYVKTADGQEGWINSTWVDLERISLKKSAIITPAPPETTVRVFGDSVNLRNGPDTNFSKIRGLAYGERLTLLGRLSDNSWLFVKTLDDQVGWINTTSVDIDGLTIDYKSHPVKTPPPTETSTPVVLAGVEGLWIDIDLSEQMLYAYEGTTLVDSFLVSTGVAEYPTETGKYRIKYKFEYSEMSDFDYNLPNVPYTMYYNGDFSIHGTYWHHSFGTPMSHGCINMDTRDAEWLYNWAPIGTLVNIHH